MLRNDGFKNTTFKHKDIVTKPRYNSRQVTTKKSIGWNFVTRENKATSNSKNKNSNNNDSLWTRQERDGKQSKTGFAAALMRACWNNNSNNFR